MKSLHELWMHKLTELYDAENQIVEALPKLREMASDEKLKAGFSEHLEQTKGQMGRLEKIATDMNMDLKGKSNLVMKTILSEGEKVLSQLEPGEVMDAALIAGAQKVEHYEIASYGAAAAWAKAMEHNDAADLLGETLDEEKTTDEKLSALAEGGILKAGINEEATEMDEEIN